MNREIKFRGLRVDGSGWVYGYYSPVNVPILGTLGHCINEGGYRAVDIKYNSLGQYTGLKDKNGKEIYEGDVLHFQTYDGGGFMQVGIDCYAEVMFGNHNLTDDVLYRSQGFYILTGKSHHPISIHYWLNSHKAVVSGNIHENPELLKGGNNE